MSVPALRPGARPRRAASPDSVEELQQLVARLARARQDLRDAGADAAALERNRLDVGQAQQELSHALIARHLPLGARRHAA